MDHTEEESAKIRMTTEAITQTIADMLDESVCCGCVMRSVLRSVAATIGANEAGNTDELKELLQIVVQAHGQGVMAIKNPANVADNVRIIDMNDPKPRPI